MRNIIVQYFSFVHGYDNLTTKLKELCEQHGQDLSFKAFDRYINRESHSDSTNFIDANEIDINKFIQFLKEAFSKTGHEKHFRIMLEEEVGINNNALPADKAAIGIE